jgi:hypothetical protein
VRRPADSGWQGLQEAACPGQLGLSAHQSRCTSRTLTRQGDRGGRHMELEAGCRATSSLRPGALHQRLNAGPRELPLPPPTPAVPTWPNRCGATWADKRAKRAPMVDADLSCCREAQPCSCWRTPLPPLPTGPSDPQWPQSDHGAGAQPSLSQVRQHVRELAVHLRSGR